MNGADRAARAAFIIFVGALGISGMASTGGAQIRRQPRPQPGQPAPQPRAPREAGASRFGYTVESYPWRFRQYRQPSSYLPPPGTYYPMPTGYGFSYGNGLGYYGPGYGSYDNGSGYNNGVDPGYGKRYGEGYVRDYGHGYGGYPYGYSFYVPSGCGLSVCDVNGRRLFMDHSAPSGYGDGYYRYNGFYGCGASVCDANGGPVLKDFDTPALAPDQGQAPPVVPDLNGSPYVVLEGGAMLVDFRNGDRRAVPSCAKQASEQTPDGKPRTIFYTPPADGLILRAGERGEVLGAPPAGARSCYTLDVYGRVVLAY